MAHDHDFEQAALELDEEPIIDAWDEEVEESLPYRYTITSYGADYPVDGLVKRMKSDAILVPTFQRGYVWSLPKASRFIESLLLRLPVPGIFLSREQTTEKLLVIDGQQRLRTLQYFYDGVFEPSGVAFALKGVQSIYEGKTHKTLSEEDRLVLDDSIIHATVVKQDEPSDDDSSIYQVFERLNTGGLQLAAQEIRTCIYHGAFAKLLKELNETASWRSVFGKPNIRMRDQELILRVLALHLYQDKYEKPMKEFLNQFMGKNRHLQLVDAETISTIFTSTSDVIFEALGSDAFRPKQLLNAAVLDAVMVGVARRLESGPVAAVAAITDQYRALMQNPAFVGATEAKTSNEETVQTRLNLATEAFKDVP